MERGYRGSGGGLLQVSLADGKKQTYDWPCYSKIPNHSHWCEGMRYDRKRNSIWISSPDGLMEFTLTDKEFHHIDALNAIIIEIYARIFGNGRELILIGMEESGWQLSQKGL